MDKKLANLEDREIFLLKIIAERSRQIKIGAQKEEYKEWKKAIDENGNITTSFNSEDLANAGYIKYIGFINSSLSIMQSLEDMKTAGVIIEYKLLEPLDEDGNSVRYDGQEYDIHDEELKEILPDNFLGEITVEHDFYEKMFKKSLNDTAKGNNGKINIIVVRDQNTLGDSGILLVNDIKNTKKISLQSGAWNDFIEMKENGDITFNRTTLNYFNSSKDCPIAKILGTPKPKIIKQRKKRLSFSDDVIVKIINYTDYENMGETS